MRSVEVTRADVIDAALYGFPEYGYGCRLVSRWTESTRPGLGHTWCGFGACAANANLTMRRSRPAPRKAI